MELRSHGVDKNYSQLQTVDTQLQLEYVRQVLDERALFSIPLQTDVHLVTTARESQLCHADATLHANMPPLQFFQVVSLSVKRRKVMSTERTRSIQDMHLPASIQYFEVDLAAGNAVTLSTRGAPVVCDIVKLTDWHVLRGGLRRWTPEAGPGPGTLIADTPVATSAREWDLCAADTPCLVIVETLFERGWQVGTRPKTHTVTSPRLIKFKDMTRKPYLECLTSMSRLLTVAFTGFPSDSPLS